MDLATSAPGRLTFVCQWPEANVELTRHDIDAQLVLDAATRAKVIFSDALPEQMASTDEPGGEQPETSTT